MGVSDCKPSLSGRWYFAEAVVENCSESEPPTEIRSEAVIFLEKKGKFSSCSEFKGYTTYRVVDGKLEQYGGGYVSIRTNKNGKCSIRFADAQHCHSEDLERCEEYRIFEKRLLFQLRRMAAGLGLKIGKITVEAYDASQTKFDELCSSE